MTIYLYFYLILPSVCMFISRLSLFLTLYSYVFIHSVSLRFVNIALKFWLIDWLTSWCMQLPKVKTSTGLRSLAFHGATACNNLTPPCMTIPHCWTLWCGNWKRIFLDLDRWASFAAIVTFLYVFSYFCCSTSVVALMTTITIMFDDRVGWWRW